MSRAVITQSNYMPWIGYFYLISLSDCFVFLDDVQYTKRDWRNRNILPSNKEKGFDWLTIPVNTSKNFYQKIEEVSISNDTWAIDHLNKIYNVYRKHPNFNFGLSFFENLYSNINSLNLSEVNQKIISYICNFLEIDFSPLQSNKFKFHNNPSERLSIICRELNADEYITGSSAKNYLDEEIFKGINIKYIDFNQILSFNKINKNILGYSVIDFIMNHGKQSPNKFKSLL